MEEKLTISKPLAPEDIQPGTYIAVLAEVQEHLPLFFAPDAKYQRIEPLKVSMLPCMCESCAGGEPLKVLEVCLPFVIAKRPGGDLRTLDTRQHSLARLSDHYGQTVFKMIKEKAKAKAPRPRGGEV
jgi:hypothetical protein